MAQCEHCNSQNVRWFTPARLANQTAVLLCMACERLTIVPPRGSLRDEQTADRALLTAA